MKQRKTEPGENALQAGDTIKCANVDDLIDTMHELEKAGFRTYFAFDINGVEGLYLEILSVDGAAQ